MATIGSLIIELRTNTAKFAQGLNKANDRLNSFSKNAFRVQGIVSTMLAGYGIKRFIGDTLDAADNVQKLSIRLKESTEALSQYRFVAKITGVEFEDITNSFAKLQKGISDAKDGLSTSATAFEDLGVSIHNLIGLGPAAQFEIIADAILKIEDPAKRTQIAMDIMGRSGSRMLSTMQEGGIGIRKLREEADKLGYTLSQEAADKAAIANDSITRLGGAVSGLGQTISIGLTGPLTGFVDWLTDVTVASKTSITDVLNWRDQIDQQFFKWLEDKIPSLQGMFDSLTPPNIKPQAPLKIDISGGEKINAIAAEMERLNGQISETTTLAKLANKVIQDSKTPLDLMIESYERLNLIKEAGVINEIQYLSESMRIQEEFLKASEQNAISWGDAWSGTFDRFAAGIGDAVADGILEQKNFGDSMRAIARGALSAVISGLVEIGVKKIALSAINKTTLAADTAASVAAAGVTAAAWAPAAAAVSIATAGGAAVAGGVALASTYSLSSGLALAGVAHDGMSSVPTDGTYLLQRGEKVVSNADSKKLDMILQGGGGTTVNVNITAMDGQDVARVLSSPQGQRVIETFAIKSVQRAYNERGQRGPVG